MYSKKVDICGINTSELPKLSKIEMEKLLKKAKDGDSEARDLLVFSNLRLVLSLIQKYIHKVESSNIDDVFQVGCVGLVKAINNFNTDLDVQFSTYAVPMIIGEIKRYIRDSNPLRVPRSIKDKAYAILSEKEKLMAKLGREPSVEELSKVSEFSVYDIVFCLDSLVQPMSFYTPVYGEDSDNIFLFEQIKDDNVLEERWVNNIAIADGVHSLNDREKNIVNMRFFQGKTQMEVSKEIGISQAQVSRLEKNALSNVKKYLK